MPRDNPMGATLIAKDPAYRGGVRFTAIPDTAYGGLWWRVIAVEDKGGYRRYVGEMKEASPGRYSMGTGSRYIAAAIERYLRHLEVTNANRD